MADTVRKVSYTYAMVRNRKGEGAKLLEALADAGISLLAFTGFPAGGGKAQVDLVAQSLGPIGRVARREGYRLARSKRAFLIQGDDRAGAVHRHMRKLADAGISVTAASAAAAGKRRFGMVLWVKPKHYGKAARALGAR